MSSLRILHVTSELTPYFPENPISSTVFNLAKSVYDQGNDVRIFMPRFGLVNERRYQLHEVIRLSGMNLIINDLDQPLIIKVASLPGERMQVYFIDNEEYFKRKALYGDDENEWFEDNADRAVFFTKGVLETIKKLNWVPDVIHVHGWMGSMLPIYLNTYYKNDAFFNDTKIVNSIYNHEYKRDLSPSLKDILTFDKVDFKELSDLVDNNVLGLLKESMNHSDIILKGEEDLIPELEEKFKNSSKDTMDFKNNEELGEQYTQIINEGILN